MKGRRTALLGIDIRPQLLLEGWGSGREGPMDLQTGRRGYRTLLLGGGAKRRRCDAVVRWLPCCAPKRCRRAHARW